MLSIQMLRQIWKYGRKGTRELFTIAMFYIILNEAIPAVSRKRQAKHV